MIENWKVVPGYEGYYEISDQGKVRSLARVVQGKKKKTVSPRVLKTQLHVGYIRAYLTKNSTTESIYVHILVWKTFRGLIPETHEIDHIDGNKTNNYLDNLQCISKPVHKALTVSRRQHARGEKVGNSKLKTKQVEEIKELLKDPTIAQNTIARRYNISQGVISSIKTGRTWKSRLDSDAEVYKKGYRDGYEQALKDLQSNRL